MALDIDELFAALSRSRSNHMRDLLDQKAYILDQKARIIELERENTHKIRAAISEDVGGKIGYNEIINTRLDFYGIQYTHPTRDRGHDEGDEGDSTVVPQLRGQRSKNAEQAAMGRDEDDCIKELRKAGDPGREIAIAEDITGRVSPVDGAGDVPTLDKSDHGLFVTPGSDGDYKVQSRQRHRRLAIPRNARRIISSDSDLSQSLSPKQRQIKTKPPPAPPLRGNQQIGRSTSRANTGPSAAATMPHDMSNTRQTRRNASAHVLSTTVEDRITILKRAMPDDARYGWTANCKDFKVIATLQFLSFNESIDAFVFLFCCFCECNAGSDKEYFHGVHGLWQHIQNAHPRTFLDRFGVSVESAVDWLEDVVLKHCTMPVEDEEAVRMVKEGAPPSHKKCFRLEMGDILVSRQASGSVSSLKIASATTKTTNTGSTSVPSDLTTKGVQHKLNAPAPALSTNTRSQEPSRDPHEAHTQRVATQVLGIEPSTQPIQPAPVARMLADDYHGQGFTQSIPPTAVAAMLTSGHDVLSVTRTQPTSEPSQEDLNVMVAASSHQIPAFKGLATAMAPSNGVTPAQIAKLQFHKKVLKLNKTEYLTYHLESYPMYVRQKDELFHMGCVADGCQATGNRSGQPFQSFQALVSHIQRSHKELWETSRMSIDSLLQRCLTKVPWTAAPSLNVAFEDTIALLNKAEIENGLGESKKRKEGSATASMSSDSSGARKRSRS